MNSLFPIKVIATLEGHKVLNNKTRTKHKTPQTMGATISNGSTTTKPPAWNGQLPKPLQWEGGLNAFYWYQILVLDYVVVKAQQLFGSHGE